MKVTAGFRTLVTDKKTDGKGLSFKILTDSSRATVIVCLVEGAEYDFECDAEITKINRAAYSLGFNGCGEFSVKVIKKN